MRRASPFLVVGIAFLSGGCDLLDYGKACTEIGCRSGLQVNFDAPATGVLRVEVRVNGPGSQPVLVYECGAAALGCANGAFFDDFDAPAALITVVSANSSQSTNVELDYIVTHPNGEDCPPDCSNATVVVAVPSETDLAS